MSWNTFDESLEFLHITLQDSLNKLLQEAKVRNCIHPPYGRPPTPSPFVNENEIDINELLNNPLECEANDRASFNYEYGFNPLIYLSQLILKAHPKSIAARKQLRNESVDRLISRVSHARKQLSIGKELAYRAKFLQSGVVHGPLTSPLNHNSVLFWCRTAIPGNLVVQISKNISFSPVFRSVIISSGGIDEPVKYILDDLEGATHYYLRCYLQGLQDDEDDTIVLEQGKSGKGASRPPTAPQDSEENDDSTVHAPALETRVYAKGEFWTLMPVSESNQLGDSFRRGQSFPLEILVLSRYPNFQLSSNAQPSPLWGEVSEDDLMNESPALSPHGNYGYGLLSKMSPHPIFTCYVGDILTPSHQTISDTGSIWNVFNNDLFLSSMTGKHSEQHNSGSPLRLGSLFLAWNDSSMGSDTSLKAEEVIYKQWSYDTRKYEKKSKERSEKEKAEPNKYAKRPLGPPPVLTRPPMTPTFNSVVKDLPVMYTEENIRHLYRSFWISKEIEVYVLDSRHGYLGKEQARWLKDSLRKSTAQYKLIFSGKSFGLQFMNQIDEYINFEREDGNGDVQGEESQTEGTEAEEEGEDVEETPTPEDGTNEQKEKSSSQKSKVSSSRQKALEATKEEFDEDGLGKTSLQHVIIYNCRKEYPDGYPLTEAELEHISEAGGDDNSSFNSPLSRSILESSRDVNDDERKRDDEGEKLTDHEDQSETISQCINSTNIHLLGGIIIFSSTHASDSYIATYSFNEVEPQIPSTLPSQTQLAAYCLEVGIGLGLPENNDIKCISTSLKNSSAERIVRQGHHLLFRSLGPISSPPVENGIDSPSSPVPILSLDELKAENSNQSNAIHGEEGIPTIYEHVDSPIASSLLLHSDGSLGIKLKTISNGRTVYQVNVIGKREE